MRGLRGLGCKGLEGWRYTHIRHSPCSSFLHILPVTVYCFTLVNKHALHTFSLTYSHLTLLSFQPFLTLNLVSLTFFPAVRLSVYLTLSLCLSFSFCLCLFVGLSLLVRVCRFESLGLSLLV